MNFFGSGFVAEYQPPYYDMLPSDPTLENVRSVVCDEGKRPLMQLSWDNHDVSRFVCYFSQFYTF